MMGADEALDLRVVKSDDLAFHLLESRADGRGMNGFSSGGLAGMLDLLERSAMDSAAARMGTAASPPLLHTLR